MLHVNYDNSLKLGTKAMKPALESSFYLKIKNKINCLIGIVRKIELLSSASLGVLKNHEIIVFVIIQKLLFLVLTCIDYQKIYRVSQKSPPLTYVRNTPVFGKLAKNMLNQIIRDLFCFFVFFTRRSLRGATLKFRMAKWVLSCNIFLKTFLDNINFLNLHLLLFLNY